MSNKAFYRLGIVFAFLNILCVCFNLCMLLIGEASLMGIMMILVNFSCAIICLMSVNSLKRYL